MDLQVHINFRQTALSHIYPQFNSKCQCPEHCCKFLTWTSFYGQKANWKPVTTLKKSFKTRDFHVFRWHIYIIYVILEIICRSLFDSRAKTCQNAHTLTFMWPLLTYYLEPKTQIRTWCGGNPYPLIPSLKGLGSILFRYHSWKKISVWWYQRCGFV